MSFSSHARGKRVARKRAKKKIARRRSAIRKNNTWFQKSLQRHAHPVDFVLRIVALPFFVLGLLQQRTDLLIMATFYLFAGWFYSTYTESDVQDIWLALYETSLNQWFSFLGLIILALGLWSFNTEVVSIGLGAYLLGLVYTWVRRERPLG